MSKFGTQVRLAAILLLLPLMAIRAQSPRVMLIEEATNASCGPCAAQNPFFEYYLALPHNQDVIPVVYHSSFPGMDVMNAANPAMHNGRVSYYGIDGVPMVAVNGRIPTRVTAGYDGAPADTAAIVNTARSVRGTISPITIDVRQTNADGEVSVSVDVNSVDAIAGARLRLVVVEGEHKYTSPPAGYNGETDFYYIARAMIPSIDGVDLKLAAGETKNIPYTFPMEAGWQAEHIYVVAFVQKDDTKEVLQAATSRGRVVLAGDMKTSIVQKSDEEPAEWNTQVSAVDAGEYSVTVDRILPSGWNAEVVLGDIAIDTEGTIDIAGGMKLPMKVSIIPTSSSDKRGVGEVSVTITGERSARLTRTFRLYSSEIQALLFIRDEGRPEILDSYDKALAKGDVVYAPVAREDEPGFDYRDYPVILYEVGKSALSGKDIATLTSYMDEGGRLFLSGAEISFSLADDRNTTSETPRDPEFMREYLHVDYLADAATNFTVKGSQGDPIGDGMEFSISTGVQNQNEPDVLTGRPGAVPIFHYGDVESNVAGIRYASSKTRLVYLGFGAEGIGNLTQRADLLKRGIAWLMGTEITTGVDADLVREAEAIGAIRPNPARDGFELPLRLGRPAHVSAALYDARGERVATLADGAFDAGTSTLRHDVSGLSVGLYNAVVTVDGATVVRTVTVVR